MLSPPACARVSFATSLSPMKKRTVLPCARMINVSGLTPGSFIAGTARHATADFVAAPTRFWIANLASCRTRKHV